MRLRATLIAQIHFGLFVAHEHDGSCAELRCQSGEHRTLGDREQAGARTGELDDDGCAVLLIDAVNCFAKAAAQELERHVAYADEGADPPREQYLDAARAPKPHGPGRERLRELGRRRHDGEHSRAAHGRESRIVGHGETRGATEAFEMDGSGEADAGASEQETEAERFAKGTLRRRARCLAPTRDATRVVGDRHFDGELPRAGEQRFGERALGLARKDHLVDLHPQKVAAQARVVGAPSEDLLGHGAGRIPRARTHRAYCTSEHTALERAGGREG